MLGIILYSAAYRPRNRLAELSDLPDVILLKICAYATFRDRLSLEEVNYRFNALTHLVWRRKKTITVPDDLGALQRRTFPPTWGSYLQWFDKSVQVLVNHCPSAQALHFASHRHMQVFIQNSLFLQIQQLNIQLKEVVIGHLYCLDDQHAVTALAEACPLLETLVIEEPYPILYRIRADSSKVCQERISNLEPGLQQLQEENGRVHEDIRLLLDLFKKLRFLKLRTVEFHVRPITD